MRRLLSALALACILPLSGCASTLGSLIKQQPEFTVVVQQPETGASITVTGLKNGDVRTWSQNSARVSLDKSQDYKLTVSAKGYEPQDFSITRTTHPLFYGNAACLAAGTCVGCMTLVAWPVTIPAGCLFSGIGAAVDMVSNNDRTFNQPDIFVSLQKPQASGLPIELRDASGRLIASRIAARVN